MGTKKLTNLTQAAIDHSLFAGYLSRWRGYLSSTCKLCKDTEETSLHLWGERPALQLEQTQLRVPGGGRPKPLHHKIINLFKHEKVRGRGSKL